jgi:hypothetical protein
VEVKMNRVKLNKNQIIDIYKNAESGVSEKRSDQGELQNYLFRSEKCMRSMECIAEPEDFMKAVSELVIASRAVRFAFEKVTHEHSKDCRLCESIERLALVLPKIRGLYLRAK